VGWGVKFRLAGVMQYPVSDGAAIIFRTEFGVIGSDSSYTIEKKLANLVADKI